MEKEPHIIPQPWIPKATFCVWVDLTITHMDRLEECRTPDEVKAFLAKYFEFEDPTNIQNRITLDYYFYILQFAKDCGFSKEQTSTFFSIMKKTHELAIETPFENIQETFTYFKELLLCHAVFRPPFSLCLFSPEEIRKISTYAVETYFRHFKMYKYAFTPQVRLDLCITYEGMPETPPPEVKTESDREATNEPIDGQFADSEVGALGEEVESKSDSPENKQEASSVESEAAKQLREMVREHLTSEIQKLKLSINDQLKSAEESINQKLSGVEASSGKKSGQASGKKKKN